MPSIVPLTWLAILIGAFAATCSPSTLYSKLHYGYGPSSHNSNRDPNRIEESGLGPGKESHQIGNDSGPIWPWQIYKSSSFNPPELQITTNGKPLAKGLIFITPSDFTKIRATKAVAPLILTDTGQLVWHGPIKNATNLRVASYYGRSILTYWSGVSSAGANVGHGYGSITFLDSSYKVISTVCPHLGLVTSDNETYPCDADLHESFVTDRNTILITAYNATAADLSSIGGPRNGWVFDSLVFEIDPRNGKILFKWSALEHIPVNETKLPLHGAGKNQSVPFDYFHINSVVNIGEKFLVNGRHVWGIYLVNSKGGIDWRLQGETGGDFGDLPAHGKFSWQHYARLHKFTKKSISISIFNNFNSQIDNGTNPTNGLEIQLAIPPDKSKPPLVLKHLSDPTDPIYADSQGSSSILPNGNIFLGYGEISVLREFGPESPSGNDVRWSARFGADNLVQSYRGFRQEWHGTPTTRPSLVVVEKGSGGCWAGYVSWNGATDVSEWAVFEGPARDRLSEIGRVGYKGFETEFAVAGRYVQVAAVVHGKIARRSKVVGTYGRESYIYA